MQPINPILVIWAASAFLAVFFLAKMMRSRQAELNYKLHSYVEKQIEWIEQKLKSRQIAKKAAAVQAKKEAALERFAAVLDAKEAEMAKRRKAPKGKRKRVITADAVVERE